MFDALENVALGQLVEVEPGAEMLALAVQHHGANVIRQRAEEFFNTLDGRIRSARQQQHGDIALSLRLERRRQIRKFAGR